MRCYDNNDMQNNQTCQTHWNIAGWTGAHSDGIQETLLWWMNIAALKFSAVSKQITWLTNFTKLLTYWHNYSWWRPQMETFPRYWPFVRGIHQSPVNSPHKGQWREAFMFSLICIWINDWVNNHKAGDLRRNRARYDVIVMCPSYPLTECVAKTFNYRVIRRRIHIQINICHRPITHSRGLHRSANLLSNWKPSPHFYLNSGCKNTNNTIASETIMLYFLHLSKRRMRGKIQFKCNEFSNHLFVKSYTNLSYTFLMYIL